MSDRKIYNNPIEMAVRLVVILQASNKALDIQELIYYDYLTLHFGDVKGNYKSLHPSNPFHSTEFILKRKLIQDGLQIAIGKGLIDIEYTEEGILYQANNCTKEFLSYFESKYYNKLKNFASLVSKEFNDLSRLELSNFFKNNIGKWKGEFEKEILFRGELND